jgi:hypothetical protein
MMREMLRSRSRIGWTIALVLWVSMTLTEQPSAQGNGTEECTAAEGAEKPIGPRIRMDVDARDIRDGHVKLRKPVRRVKSKVCAGEWIERQGEISIRSSKGEVRFERRQDEGELIRILPAGSTAPFRLEVRAYLLASPSKEEEEHNLGIHVSRQDPEWLDRAVVEFEANKGSSWKFYFATLDIGTQTDARTLAIIGCPKGCNKRAIDDLKSQLIMATATEKPTKSKHQIALYDAATGHSIEGDFDTRLVADCTNRESPAPVSTRDKQNNPADTLAGCLVIKQKQQDGNEYCIVLPPSVVKENRSIAIFLNAGKASSMPECPPSAPVSVLFERPPSNNVPGQFIDGALIYALASVPTINAKPIVFNDGRFQVSLRPDEAQRITQSDIRLGPNLKLVGAYLEPARREIRIQVIPNVVDVSQLKFELKDLGGEPARGCVLKLRIPNDLRGPGFEQLAEEIKVVESAGGQSILALPVLKTRAFLRVPEAQGEVPQLEHLDAKSREECYFRDVALEADELRSGVVKRRVGKPQPGLVALITADARVKDMTQAPDEQWGAYEMILDVVNKLSTKRIDGERPYQYAAISFAADVPPRMFKGGRQLFDLTRFGTAQREFSDRIGSNAVAANLDSLGTVLEGVLNAQGNSDPSAPAHVIYAGTVFRPMETSCIHGVDPNKHHLWLGESRALLILAMLSERQAEDYLAKEDGGRSLHPALKLTNVSGIYECAHQEGNPRVRQYVLKVPEVLRPREKTLAVKFLEAQASALFHLQ